MPFNFRELKKGDKVECIFTGFIKSVGAFRKSVFTFVEVGKKKEFHLWGTVMLSYLLYGLPFNSRLTIKFLGMIDSDTGKHKMKGYEIDVLGTDEIAKPTVKRSARPRRS